MTPYPIPGLTRSQREVFEQIATGNATLLGFNRPRAVAKLLELGAIVSCGRKVVCKDRFGTVTVPEYGVPIPLHMVWCAWVGENYDDEGNPL